MLGNMLRTSLVTLSTMTDEPTGEYPEQSVMRRIVAARKQANMTQAQLTARLRETFGTFGESTYRKLEAAPFNDHDEPWKTRLITQQLATAIADALGVPLTDIATSDEYSQLSTALRRKSPSNAKPAPETKLASPAKAVHNPSLVAARAQAFMHMYGYTPRTLASEIRFRGYKVTETELRRAFRAPRTLTHELLDGIVRVFTAQTRKPFDKQRLLTCEPSGQPCPHCRSYLIERNGSNA